MRDIFHIMAGAKVGGAEKFFERLVPALQQDGFHQAALIRHHADREQILRSANVDVHTARFAKPLLMVTRWQVGRLLRQYQPKMAIAWMNRAAQSVPNVGSSSVICARLGGYYKLKNYQRCQYLIGNTRGICTWLVEQGWPADRVEYLPNFVDEALAEPIDRKIYDTPQDVPLMVGIGRLHANKGFDLAIRALQQIQDAYLWLAGSGPLQEQLRQLAIDLGVQDRVRFLGWVANAKALMASADMLLCSSRIEPLGNIVLEAWAHNTPVVAMDIQGPKELITHGENGLLFGPEDLGDMVANIQACLFDDALQTKLRTSGHNRYFDQFSQNKTCAKYREFFDRVTG